MAGTDPLNVELAGRILKLMRSALNNSRIYPAGSQIVINTVNQLYSVLQEFLGSCETFTISELNRKMIVQGQDIKTLSDTFITGLMSDNEIQNIQFNRGLTPDELSTFIDLFSRRKEQIKSGPGIIELLKSSGVRNIIPAQVKYVAISEGDEVVKRVSSIVDHLQYEPHAFMTSLREIYDGLDEIRDENVKKDMTSMLAKKMTTLDPAQLKDFFDRTLPKKIQESGLQEAVTQALSEEKIKDIFQEITGWYDEIKKNVTSEFEAAEQLTSLRNFLGKILNSPAARNLPFRFYEELLRVGVLEEMPEFIKKDEPSLTLRVDKLLEGDSAALLDPEIRDELPEIVRQLLQAELEEIVNRLTSKIAENLQQTSLKARSDSMQTLLRIFDIVIPFQKEKILQGLEIRFLKQVKTETDIDIFRGIANILRKRMFQLILRGDYENATAILGIFKQHKAEGVEPDAEKRSVINEVFTSFAGEISPLLVNDLKSGVDARQASAMKIVILLEDTMSGVLMQLIKETDDYRTRRTAASVLKNIGQHAIKRFFDSLDLSISTETLKKLIDIFDEFLPFDYSGKLIELLDYPEISVKKAVLRQLAKTAQSAEPKILSQIKSAVTGLLKDKDIAQNAVHLAAEMKITEALPEMISMLGSAPVPVQEEICVAMSVFRNHKSVPALVKILKVKKSFFGGASAASDSVRVRAAWALRYFPGPETERALNEALKDKNGTIRNAAAQSIEQLKKR